MTDTLLSLREAAKMLGISKRSVLRAMYAGRVQLLKNRRGCWCIYKSALIRAPLLLLGQAAKRFGLHYETLRRAAAAGRLRTASGTRLEGGRRLWLGSRRHVSLLEAHNYASQRRKPLRPNPSQRSHAG